MKKLTIGAIAAGAVLAGGMLAGPVTGTGTTASHVDSPRLIADGQMDGSDLYAHTCPDDADMVCIVTNYAPAQQGGGTAFATDARYEVHIDQRGTGKAGITYRWTFQPPSGERQSYTLEEIHGGKQTFARKGSAPLARADVPAHWKGAAVELPGGGRTFAAKAADPFYSNAQIVGLALTGIPVIPPIDLIEALDGNVNTMVLQVPKKRLALGGDVARNPVIGVSATAGRRTMGVDGADSAAYPQMSRLGNPALDVVTFFSMGEQFNTMPLHESGRDPKLTDFIRNPKAPGKIQAVNGSAKAPPAPRHDLWQIYLRGIAKETGPIRHDLNAHELNKDAVRGAIIPSDQLRLNMTTPLPHRANRFGLLEGDAQGYPNGRRLGDDIHSITVRMLMGEPAGPGTPALLAELSNRVTKPKAPVRPLFPYMPLPHFL